jgi:predicted PurR-regulated permease PerM
MSEVSTDHGSPRPGFVRRALVIVGIVTAVALGIATIVLGVDVLLLTFAGILVAIFLTTLTSVVTRLTPLPHGWALGLVVVVLAVLVGGSGWLLAPRVAVQVDELSERLPLALGQVRDKVEQYGWGKKLLQEAPEAGDLIPRRRDVVGAVTGVFSTTLGAVANIFIVMLVGLYLAAEPGLYTTGLLRLFPKPRRPRLRQVLDAEYQALRMWLLGKLASMTLVGALTAIGLWWLDVPIALTLGILAALLTFIPNIGPVLAIVPAALLALVDSPTKALYVVGLYAAVQIIESYVFTPLLQRRTVALPPVLGLFAQVLLGILLGGLGVVLATPLAVFCLVATRMLYVEDALDDSVPE